MSEETPVIGAVAEIVSAYVSNNRVEADALPGLINLLHKTVSGLIAGVAAPEPAPPIPKATPAAVRKSITADGLVSFEDGRTYQTLKRHLNTQGLTVEAYKKKWGLPDSYPTTSPAYAAKRSELAKAAGLGRRIGKSAPPPPPPPPVKATKAKSPPPDPTHPFPGSAAKTTRAKAKKA